MCCLVKNTVCYRKLNRITCNFNIDILPFSAACIDEIDALDPCNGHSNPALQYHYHLTPECIDGAADGSACLLLGYMDDGFQVFGQCGSYNTCWRQVEGTTGDNMRDFYYDQAAFDAGECSLDECGGKTVNGTYAYYTAPDFPYVPICRMGTKGKVCGFTP